jgi:hypothetical protein
MPPGRRELLGRAHIGLGVVDRARLAGTEVVLGLVHEPDEQPTAEGGQPHRLGVDGGVVGAGGDVGPADRGAAVQDVHLPAVDRLAGLDVAGRLARVAAHQAPSRGTSLSDTGGPGGVQVTVRVARRLAAAGTARRSNFRKPWSFCAAVLRTRSSVVS